MASDLTITSTETFTIPTGESYWSDPVYVGGTLNLGGTLYLTPGEDLAATGVADTVGTAALQTFDGSISATGTAAAAGGASLSAETDLSATGTAAATGTASMEAEMALSTDEGSADFPMEFPAGFHGGNAAAVGSAYLSAEASLSATGEAEATGTALMDTLVPLYRRNTVSVDSDRRDDLRVDADRTDDMRVQGTGEAND